MAARPLILYPDPRLDLPSEPVGAFDADLRDLARDVTEALDAA
ncbi:peptide deformylase, partial [Methylobacterium sp. WL122]